MKITAVEVLSPDAGTSAADATRPGSPVPIRLHTDAGLTGLAVLARDMLPAVGALVRERLAGADPRAAMGLWERLRATQADPRARAALDVAIWDLKAKANGEPLWKTLGGTRPRAPAHLAWDTPWDGRRATDWFRRGRAETGIRSASLAAGADPAGDLEAMSGVRDVLDATVPESILMLRFDGGARPHDVIRHVRTLETSVDLACVCSPVRGGDVRGARLIGDAVRAAVCVGRGIGDVEGFLPYLQHYAANVIELDVAALGISGTIQVADAAFGYELPVLLTAYPGHVPVHLFPALPTAMSVEVAFSDAAVAVSAAGITFEGGRASAGFEPGNGMAPETGGET